MEEKKIKTIIALAILVFILLSGNLIVSIIQEIDYNKRKNSGDTKWLQVENRILQIEEKVNEVQNGRNT
jgi:hypothetical protein|nr:MAG TPA: hypothetical protein [Caudoviricetes sp.]